MTDDELLGMILHHEGSVYTDHPDDAGGPTRYGVTMAILAQYRGVPLSQVLPSDIEHLSWPEAQSVYRSIFIAPFDRLADPLRASVIDMGVNAGVYRAVILLQETVGAGVDGRLGQQTLTLANIRNWSPVYVGVRLGFYENLIRSKPKNMTWRNGWRIRALSFLDPVRHLHRLSVRPLHSEPLWGFMGKAL